MLLRTDPAKAPWGQGYMTQAGRLGGRPSPQSLVDCARSCRSSRYGHGQRRACRVLFDNFEVRELPQNEKRLALVGRAMANGLITPTLSDAQADRPYTPSDSREEPSGWAGVTPALQSA